VCKVSRLWLSLRKTSTAPFWYNSESTNVLSKRPFFHKRVASNEGGTFQKGKIAMSAANGQPPGRTACVPRTAEQQQAFDRQPSSRRAPTSHQQQTVTAESIDHQIALTQQ
jgi:hypothetical protein